jgi:plastocyanin
MLPGQGWAEVGVGMEPRRTRRLVAVITALAGVLVATTCPAGQTVTLTVTGPDNRPVPGVALFLPDVRTEGSYPRVVVDQRREAFVPLVSVATAGDEVQFSNGDPTSHHVYSFSRPNAFELPLYKGNARLNARFMHPGVVVLGCNIHDAMIGYVVVVDSTRRGVTDKDGRVTLTDVPAGRHAVRAWAPGLDRDAPPEVGAVDVRDSGPASATFRIAVGRAATAPRKAGALVESDY